MGEAGEAVARGWSTANGGGGGLDRVVELAQTHLHLDLVLACELTGTGPVVRALSGDSSLCHARGQRPLSPNCSGLLASEQTPIVVPDATRHPRAAHLGKDGDAQVGSFVGVPLWLSSGQLYGTLWGIKRNADPTLGQRDLNSMAMLAALVKDELDQMQRTAEVSRKLHHVIESGSVTTAYQPVVSLRSGSCLGLEALARFPAGLGPPDQLFAEADAVDMRLELERLAIIEAWPGLERIRADQFVAFNLSPDSLVELARRAQERDDIPLPQIVIEITEQTVVESYGLLRTVLDPLRARGMRLSVDDAGAGYASLRHIVELQPDFIKIDRLLVEGAADDQARRVVVSAFLLLALDLGAVVVAEGVERPEDLKALYELGVPAAQGYLLGRPTSDDAELSNWIEGAPWIGTVLGVDAMAHERPVGLRG